jgi:hypothetical protein
MSSIKRSGDNPRHVHSNEEDPGRKSPRTAPPLESPWHKERAASIKEGELRNRHGVDATGLHPSKGRTDGEKSNRIVVGNRHKATPASSSDIDGQ